jgi:hypothetical protein
MEEGDEGEEAEVSEDSLVSQAQTTSVPLASMTTICSLEDRTGGGYGGWVGGAVLNSLFFIFLLRSETAVGTEGSYKNTWIRSIVSALERWCGGVVLMDASDLVFVETV